MKVYACLYNVSSVQRVLDFVKTVYAFGDAVIPVIVKPVGAAAQIGVPDAYKYAFKHDKPLIILPDLPDIGETIPGAPIYLISGRGEEIDPRDMLGSKNLVIVFNGSDTEFTRQEMQYGKPVRIRGIPHELPSTAVAAIVLYKIIECLGRG